MNLVISGRNIDITEGLRSAVEDKIGKLERYFNAGTEVHVTLSTEKSRQKIEVTIPMKGSIIRAEQTSTDQAAAQLSKDFLEEDAYDDEEIEIIRTKKFAMKPMDPEEACVQMELLGHNFFVFRNGQTDEVNVVYKRKGNTYGLIEPEF